MVRKPTLNSLSAERLRELLNYDPETGIFTWRVDRYRRVKAGAVAGSACHKKGYRFIRVEYTRYLAHRLAWLYVNGKWPTEEIDHIDGNTDFNAISNLREATHTQNMRNRRKHKPSRSGLKGVKFYAPNDVWVAHITVDGVEKHLGYRKTAAEAHKLYVDAAAKYFGEFANVGYR